jgi:hypothetical protein
MKNKSMKNKSGSKKYQNLYKMRGCSKKLNKRNKKPKTYRKYLGGDNINLAYTGQPIQTVPNPFLSYTGAGLEKAYPSSGPADGPDQKGTNWINPPLQSGGQCGSCGILKGGGENASFVGKPWTPDIKTWPGVSSGGNYYKLNTYQPNDVSRQIENIGANPPFLGAAMKGGKKSRKGRKGRKSRKQKGGSFSNTITQDFINLGNQLKFGAGSAYNAINGYPSPANPLPWKSQLVGTPNITSVKAALL